jgi:hypothetical protein
VRFRDRVREANFTGVAVVLYFFIGLAVGFVLGGIACLPGRDPRYEAIDPEYAEFLRKKYES